MTTSRADLLAGVDMEGGEGFCDSIYNFLKNQGKDINLFTNSGFGVWSQSDTDKGLGTLPFDSGSVAPVVGELLTDPNSGATGKVIWLEVTGGTWGGTNAAGNIYLGAVTGTFQDNSDITGSVGGANILTVNGDESIGRTNDPMNNDDTGDWATIDCNLAFAAAEYTITRTAASQIISKTCSLEEGHTYKIEIDIKDGTEAGVDVLGYTNNVGGAVVYPYFTTAAGWASVSWTFEATATDAVAIIGIAVYLLVGGQTIEVRRFSVYEITPCCTAADNDAFDGWEKDTTIDIYREYYGTNTKGGSFYSLCCVPGDAGDYVIFDSFNTNTEFTEPFADRPLTVGVWAKTSTANHFRWVIQDGAAYLSSYHTGSGNWEWIELTVEVSAAPTRMWIYFTFDVAPDINGDTIVYTSQPMAVHGWSLGEGMYQPRLQEVINCEAFIASNLLNAQPGLSTIAWTDINVEADSDARLPKGCKVVWIYTDVNDISLAFDSTLFLRADATTAFQHVNAPAGLANDARNRAQTRQSCEASGDIQYTINAQGAGTFDITYFRYLGVQVN